MKAGAVNFLAKPFRDQDMLDAVAAAISLDQSRRRDSANLANLRARYDQLTPRAREVMAYVVTGLMRKQVAGIIGLSEITVKIHRGTMMHKMGTRTLADLVRQAAARGIEAQAATSLRMLQIDFTPERHKCWFYLCWRRHEQHTTGT